MTAGPTGRVTGKPSNAGGSGRRRNRRGRGQKRRGRGREESTAESVDEGPLPEPRNDTERAAREMPDGKTIAHGYMTLSLIPALTKNFIEVANLSRAINFGANKVRFYSPVTSGARVRARATLLQARRRGGALLLTSEVRIEIEGERKPACVAEILGMYFFDE